MPARWVEDAEGRHWSVGQPEIVENDSMSHLERDGLVMRKNVCLKTVITVHCMVQEGQSVPDSAGIVDRVTRALTLGGSQSQRICPPEPAATVD